MDCLQYIGKIGTSKTFIILSLEDSDSISVNGSRAAERSALADHC